MIVVSDTTPIISLLKIMSASEINESLEIMQKAKRKISSYLIQQVKDYMNKRGKISSNENSLRRNRAASVLTRP